MVKRKVENRLRLHLGAKRNEYLKEWVLEYCDIDWLAFAAEEATGVCMQPRTISCVFTFRGKSALCACYHVWYSFSGGSVLHLVLFLPSLLHFHLLFGSLLTQLIFGSREECPTVNRCANAETKPSCFVEEWAIEDSEEVGPLAGSGCAAVGFGASDQRA